MRIVRAYGAILICLLSIPAVGSTKLGVAWFSVIEKEQDQLYLQVNHLFLGAGAREAIFELKGCTEKPLWFEVAYDDKGNRFFSEIPLETCDFSEPLTLGLYFMEEGEKRLFRVYDERPVQLKVLEEVDLFFTCSEQSLYFGGRIPPNKQQQIMKLAYKQDRLRSEVNSIRVWFGYNFSNRVTGSFDCTQISGGYINDTFFPTFEIP